MPMKKPRIQLEAEDIARRKLCLEAARLPVWKVRHHRIVLLCYAYGLSSAQTRAYLRRKGYKHTSQNLTFIRNKYGVNFPELHANRDYSPCRRIMQPKADPLRWKIRRARRAKALHPINP